MVPYPVVDGKGTQGGYCGPAIKPIALSMVYEVSRHLSDKNVAISGIGGISNWNDAAEYIALGCSTVQVCTAAMHHGFQIVEDMISGLTKWMEQKSYKKLEDFRAQAMENVATWNDLNLNYKVIAAIDQEKCIGCGLCYKSCEDTSHQAIAHARVGFERKYEIIEENCVGCNLCQMVCPVEGCIEMVQVENGKPYLKWAQHPNNL